MERKGFGSDLRSEVIRGVVEAGEAVEIILSDKVGRAEAWLVNVGVGGHGSSHTSSNFRS